MPIRVAQVSTGNAGRLTLRQLIADDRFELVGTPVGIEHLGGVDFDQAVFDHVRDAVGVAGHAPDGAARPQRVGGLARGRCHQRSLLRRGGSQLTG